MLLLRQQVASALRKKKAPRSAHYDANSSLPRWVHAPFLRPAHQAPLCVGPSKGASPPPVSVSRPSSSASSSAPSYLSSAARTAGEAMLPLPHPQPFALNFKLQHAGAQRKRPRTLMESPPRRSPRLREDAQVAYPDASGVKKWGAVVCGGWRGF